MKKHHHPGFPNREKERQRRKWGEWKSLKFRFEISFRKGFDWELSEGSQNTRTLRVRLNKLEYWDLESVWRPRFHPMSISLPLPEVEELLYESLVRVAGHVSISSGLEFECSNVAHHVWNFGSWLWTLSRWSRHPCSSYFGLGTSSQIYGPGPESQKTVEWRLGGRGTRGRRERRGGRERRGRIVVKQIE